MSSRPLELLAPARDAGIGRTAVLAGADAVYIGAPAFGARAAAGNSVEDIAGLCAFAHQYGARVYVTMNTILFDNELDDARALVWQLYAAGVDALIVQDMAYLEMDLPSIALHASTQCDIRTPAKARMLAEAGFSQLVLPREFSLEEITAARQAAGVPVEVFVHGALCVSYSGDCQAGAVAMGRSANRGVCPQMCRLPYELVDARGQQVAPKRHYLSLRDLNQSQNLEALADAGASSFKIEGRLKDARYVTNVVAAYSRRLDEIIARNPEKYHRAAWGKSDYGFEPDPDRTFNRGYTSYFLRRPHSGLKMASLDTPKWAGRPVGKVTGAYDAKRGCFRARLTDELANGDGLGFFDTDRHFVGFRLNRVAGDLLFPAQPQPELRPGTTLYRNNDKAFFDKLERPCERRITVYFELWEVDEQYFAIRATDERGASAVCNIECERQEARSEQTEQRLRTLGRLGDTIYSLGRVDDRLGLRFVAASVLTNARREVLEMLGHDAAARYAYDRRRPDRLAPDAFASVGPLDYHWNVANRLARKFYEAHGATVSAPAIEVKQPEGDVTVMTTRYCIRRELGACLREKDAKRLPSPLFLRNESGLYRLDFDCARCGMKVVKTDN